MEDSYTCLVEGVPFTFRQFLVTEEDKNIYCSRI